MFHSRSNIGRHSRHAITERQRRSNPIDIECLDDNERFKVKNTQRRVVKLADQGKEKLVVLRIETRRRRGVHPFQQRQEVDQQRS